MALTLSDSDRTYVQNLTAIGTTETIIDNIFLDDLYTRARGNLDITVALVWEAILADYAKLVTYSNGLQSENLSDLFDHLLKLADRYRAVANNNQQFVNVALRPTPIKHKERPWTQNLGHFWPRTRRMGGGDWW